MMTRLTILILAPVIVCAQPPHGRGFRVNQETAKQLNLTDAQKTQIDQVNHEFRQRLFELRDAVNKAEAGVDAVFNVDPVDQAKYNEAIEKLLGARSELSRAASQQDLKIRMILTAQQWQQLKQIEREWPARGPHRRPPTAPGTIPNPQK
jgi:Spy/CpxP family protein refolding chaperone